MSHLIQCAVCKKLIPQDDYLEHVGSVQCVDTGAQPVRVRKVTPTPVINAHVRCRSLAAWERLRKFIERDHELQELTGKYGNA